jgi:DNA processing protein
MSSDFKELSYFVGLNKIGMGPKTFLKLFKKYKSAEKIWNLEQSELMHFGLQTKTIERFLSNRKKINPTKELDQIQKLKINLVTMFDKNYPNNLTEISNSPYILFYKGDLNILNNLSIGVVGTRKMTPYGKRVCEQIIFGLAKNNINIVSGLALGIDAVAHKTTLESGGLTTAVLGTSLDFIYPSANFQLAEKIIQNGLIVSEFPLGTRGFPSNFPIRNRIISGLSIGVVVIEAATISGSLITANYALEQNREVFTIPGSIYSPQSVGCNNLIKMGAKVVTSYEDILDELNIKNKIKEEKEIIKFETQNEKKIWNILDFENPANIDKIIEKTGISVSEISSILTLMEIRGLIKNIGGQQYVKK